MRRLALVTALALAAIACTSAAATTPKPKILGNAKNGRKLFIAQQCGSCHLMGAANQMDGSGLGPDLDHVTKTYTQIVTQITKGGRGMTGYKKALTTSQIEDLAAFIYTTSHK
ncbi:MAG TPA: cytochrome c [Gaiellaceae bacterium]|jgi:mono/diheme cytochrome c family protein|nr:cytochrome c [Gaiellaceae bacterium]